MDIFHPCNVWLGQAFISSCTYQRELLRPCCYSIVLSALQLNYSICFTVGHGHTIFGTAHIDGHHDKRYRAAQRLGGSGPLRACPSLTDRSGPSASKLVERLEKDRGRAIANFILTSIFWDVTSCGTDSICYSSSVGHTSSCYTCPLLHNRTA